MSSISWKIGNMSNRLDIVWHCWCCRNQQTSSRAGSFYFFRRTDFWRRYSSAIKLAERRIGWRDDCVCEQSISKKLFAGSSDSICDDSRYRESDFSMEFFVGNLERIWQQRITNDRKLALFVHTSCLIERLIRNEAIENYHASDTLLQCHEKTSWKEIKKRRLVSLKKVYSVAIPESEVLLYLWCFYLETLILQWFEADFLIDKESVPLFLARFFAF